MGGAGDQGLMFGYATDETEECMPLTVVLAHALNKKISDLRRDGTLWWARPDSKTQVTCECTLENGAVIPTRVHTVVISAQHTAKVSLECLRQDLMEKVIKTTIPKKYLDKDTYGGAFSGKDYTKVDRSGAYAARWVAKSLVKAGLCRRCLVQVSYAIGLPEPLSVTVLDYGTGTKTPQELTEIVKQNFDLRPGRIVKDLKLKNPIFQQTA